MDVNGLINSIEVELEQTTKERDKSVTEVKYILEKAKQEGRAALSVDEDERVKQLFATRDRKEADLAGIQVKLDAAKRAKLAEAEVEEAQQQRVDTGARLPAYDQVARVGAEERTYRADKDRKGAGFLRDVCQQFLYRNAEAEHRLTRHMQEERVERSEYLQRAVGTGAFTGLTVPQYLTDMYAPKVAALRPFADICNKHDLPAEGMTVNISRITTESSVDLQTTENTAVAEQDMDDTLLTEKIQTAAGQQTLSRQAIDRGTGIEEVTMDDMFRRYATNLDGKLITQATTGLSAIGNATTYTSANPTAAELYPKLLGACADVEDALLTFGFPTHAVMSSRRWNWFSAQMTDKWPLIGQQNIDPLKAGENKGQGYGNGIRGVLPNGLAVVVDNNIPRNLGTGTNEDEMYVVPADECHLWEDPQAPVFIRAEQPKAASLGVLLVVYGYFAYCFRRYEDAISKISGTGLATPAF